MTNKGFWSPRFNWELTSNPINAGMYQAIGIDLQGISSAQLEELRTALDATKTNLEAEQLDGLTKHNVVGDFMQAGVMGYFSLTNSMSGLMAKASGMSYYREPSYGTFSTNLTVEYFYGQPRTVHFDEVMMDIDRLKSSAESKINCWNEWSDFNQASGQMMSAFEHLVPEQLFKTETESPQGVSAVKAIQIALSENQKVYTLTSANRAQMSNITIVQQSRDEILAAIDSGKTVTVHEQPINAYGFNGSAYMIIDPDTGAGAYKISSGDNGALIALFGSAAVGLIGMFMLLNGIGTALAAAMIISFAIHIAVISLAILIAEGALNPQDILAGSAAALSVLRGIAVLLAGLGLRALLYPEES